MPRTHQGKLASLVVPYDTLQKEGESAVRVAKPEQPGERDVADGEGDLKRSWSTGSAQGTAVVQRMQTVQLLQ